MSIGQGYQGTAVIGVCYDTIMYESFSVRWIPLDTIGISIRPVAIQDNAPKLILY